MVDILEVLEEARYWGFQRCQEDTLHGQCWHCSTTIMSELVKLGYTPTMVYAKFWNDDGEDESHYWVRLVLDDVPYILDVTATQFGWREQLVCIPEEDVDLEECPWWSNYYQSLAKLSRPKVRG